MKLVIQSQENSIVPETTEQTIIVAPFDIGVGKIPYSLIDAKGDLIVGTGADTATRLPVGTDGQVLTASSGSTSGLAFQTPSGGVADGSPAGGRLTLESGVGLSTTAQTAKTVVYYTPFVHDLIGLYYNSSWERYTLTEKSIKTQDIQNGTLTNGSAVVTNLSDTSQLVTGMSITGTGIAGGTTISTIDSSTQITMSANATASGVQSLTISIPASSVVDIFAYYTGTTVKLSFGKIWTNATTRATALTTQNGIYVLSGDTSKRYLGTVATTTTAGQTEYSTSKRLVWNMYNRKPVPLSVVDTTNSWTYNLTAWHQANASTSNEVGIVVGLSEDQVEATALEACSNAAGWLSGVATGIGIDSATTNSAQLLYGFSTTVPMPLQAIYRGYPGVGYHTIKWLERAYDTYTVTFYGDNGSATGIQSGMVATLFA